MYLVYLWGTHQTSERWKHDADPTCARVSCVHWLSADMQHVNETCYHVFLCCRWEEEISLWLYMMDVPATNPRIQLCPASCSAPEAMTSFFLCCLHSFILHACLTYFSVCSSASFFTFAFICASCHHTCKKASYLLLFLFFNHGIQPVMEVVCLDEGLFRF